MKKFFWAVLMFPVLAGLSLANESYRVLAGDTLGAISAKFGVSYLDIMAANKMENASVYPGQVLIIPTQQIPPPPLSAAAPGSPTSAPAAVPVSRTPAPAAVPARSVTQPPLAASPAAPTSVPQKGSSQRIPAPGVPGYSGVSPYKDNTPIPPTSGNVPPAAPHYPGTAPSRASSSGKPASVEVPASGAVGAPKNSRGSLYVVQKGDTVRSICKKFGVAFWDLRQENDILFSTIRPGQVLKIPSRPASVGIAY